MKDIGKKIGSIVIFILILVSIPILSTSITTDLFRQGTGILPKVNALPLEIGEDAMDIPVTAGSILGDRFEREETEEDFGQSPSQSPSNDNEGVDVNQSPVQSDLNNPSAEIVRGQGDEIPNQYLVVLKNKLPTTRSEAAERRF